jgi:hypothetical protein
LCDRTSQIKRSLEELAGYLFMELDHPKGAFLSTGTGIVPGQEMSLWPTMCWGNCCGGLPSAGTIQPRCSPHGRFLRVMTTPILMSVRAPSLRANARLAFRAAYGARKWSGSLRFCNSR